MTNQIVGQQQALSAALSVYSTAELAYTVQNLLTSPNFLLDRFFTRQIVSDKAEIAIDILKGKRRLAPFVAPLQEGKPVESLTTETKLFTPPYIKDLRIPDLMRPIQRAIGEPIGGAISPRERLEANIANELRDQIDMINRSCEWMAAQILLNGKVIINGDGYANPVEMDFQRDPANSVVLVGDAQWGKPGVSPTAYLDKWSIQILQKTGAYPTDAILTSSAWEQFIVDPVFTRALLSQRDVGPVSAELGTTAAQGGVYKGTWGNLRLWLYNDWFCDPVTNEERPMIPDGTVLLSGPSLEGLRAFGLIIDADFAYEGIQYAPKMWVEKNPGQVNMLMQSAPLIIPTRVDASLSARVINPAE